MIHLIYGLAAGAAVIAVLAGKNKVEDAVTSGSDSFTRWDPLFQKYAAIEGVSWPMLKAIAMIESSLGSARSVARGISNPEDIAGSTSSDGKSWGLMQLTLPTLRDFDPSGNEMKLNNPEYSIKYAAKLLRSLSHQFDGEEEWIVKSYNQGAGNSRKEMNGDIDGYAADYWSKYQRNRALVLSKQGV